jgi:hypothetical protein
MKEDKNLEQNLNNSNEKLHISDVSNSGLDEPTGYATTAELMLMFGKTIDEALDIHNDLEKIVSSDDV